MDDDKTNFLNLTSVDSLFPVVVKKPELKKYHSRSHATLMLKENRIMSKRGRINIRLNKIPDKSIRYGRDLWNTMVNMRWRWIMVVVGLVNTCAYLIFAGCFLFDAWISGDFDNIEGHKTCVHGINHNFSSFFTLSIETITTTGYGYLYPTENCRLIIIIFTFSTLVTILIDGAFISVVYAKMGKPTTSMSIFSRKAVISMRNGKLCLIIRVNDRSGKHWISSRINLYLIRDFTTIEGERMSNYILELEIQPFGMLFVPVDIVHEINSNSPLWHLSAQDLISCRFEILAVVSGNSIHTGQPVKNQTSYLSKEIIWGYQFAPCLDYDCKKFEYRVNLKNFNKTSMYDMPLCNAAFLGTFRNEFNKRRSAIV